MKKTYLLAGLGIGLVSLTAVSVAFAASGDYSAWRTMMGDRGGKATQVVTEQNFDRFTEMHRLIGEGNYNEAQKIRTDLGLGQGRANRGGGCGMNATGDQQGGGCGMRNGGSGSAFLDENKNGICDHAEQLTK